MKTIERLLLENGISPIAGVDEAGRGACAGPLLVAAVILKDPFSPDLALVRDSKELSEGQREELYEIIIENALSVSIVEIASTVIDERGVHVANIDGMRRAVQGLSVLPRYVLTDGYVIPGLGISTLGIWKGDQVVHTISAASIIAKVTRDRIMRDLDTDFPQYGFGRHKGYVTSTHSAALSQFGPCEIHRRSFANVAARIHREV
ncbi:MAG: ribonuclease HII [Actinobacteria bacterium]|nr:ribonuclease HII [Actinomycetota bacterium]